MLYMGHTIYMTSMHLLQNNYRKVRKVNRVVPAVVDCDRHCTLMHHTFLFTSRLCNVVLCNNVSSSSDCIFIRSI